MTVIGVVLAAGEGSRFAGSMHKLLAEVDGRPLVEHALLAATSAGLDEVLIVHGAVDLTGWVPAEVASLRNPAWREGLATSLLMATSHSRSHGHDAMVIGLADQPGVGADAWRAVAAAGDDPPIAVATYEGRRGNPVRLHRSVWDLLPVRGDEGARALMRQRPELVAEVPCAGDPHDIDTLEDLRRWS